MRLNVRLQVLIMALFGCLYSFAQTTPQEAVVKMGRGINLGNTLDDPKGEGGTWGNYAKEEFFEAYKEAGFTNVRIPITWGSHVEESAPYTVDETFMKRVEEVVGWAQDRDMWVVINAHHEDWLFENPTQENFDRLDSVWKQVSTYFKDHDETLVFEILNEPRTLDHVLSQKQVDDLNARILAIIRETNPTRNVIIGGQGWSSKQDLMDMKIPEDDYLIGYFHSYDPWDFAGEGNGTWGESPDVITIIDGFKKVADWSADNNLPVYVGEFSARTKCDYNSRMKWFAIYVKVALSNGFAFSTWDDNGWFQILDRDYVTWSEAKDVLIYFSDESPTSIQLENVDGGSVGITWKNGSVEYDSIHVERGMTPSRFSHLATVSADEMSFVDNSVILDKNYYYRIKAFISDTEYTYSYPQKIKTEEPVVTALVDLDYDFIVFPNPTNANVFVKSINNSEEILNVSVYTLQGVKVIDITDCEEGVIELKTDALKANTYLVEIKTATQNIKKVLVKK